ncbi:TetR/AcrR family transcriptional regulator [Chloroflexota bacterium]
MKNRSKKYETQKRMILDKASALFWEKGYEKTSLRKIADSCGFEAPNMYNYFHNKETLFFEIIREETASIVQALTHLKEAKAGNPSERLAELIRIHLEYNVGPKHISGGLSDSELKSLSFAHRVKVIALRREYDNILFKIVKDGIDAGDFNGVDGKIACFAIASIIVRVRIWFSPRGRMSAKEVADNIIKLVLNGLACGSKKKAEKASDLKMRRS